MLTSRGFLLLIESTITILLVSTFLYNPQLFLAAIFIHFFIIFYMFINFQKLKKYLTNAFNAERNIYYDVSSLANVIEVTVSASPKINEPLVAELKDEFHEEITPIDGTTFKLDTLGPDGKIKIKYKARLKEQFKIVIFRHVNLILYDPLMIIGRKITLEAPGEIYSSETLFETTRILLNLRNQQAKPPIGIGVNPFTGHDEEFISVKTYEEGDSIRYIHWKKSASLQSEDLLVKKFEKLAKTKISIIVDCSSAINAGILYPYIETVKSAIITIMRTALESGNEVRIYLLNSTLPNQQLKKTEIRNIHEALLVTEFIFPTSLIASPDIFLQFSKELQKNSYIIVFTNPPTTNNKIIKDMIDLAINKDCKIIIFMPSIKEYYPSVINNFDFTQLIEFDELLKSKWSSIFGDKVTIYYVSPTSYIFDTKRIFMGRKTH